MGRGTIDTESKSQIEKMRRLGDAMREVKMKKGDGSGKRISE